MSIAAGERFIAKLALGFAALSHAGSFLTSDDAALLRSFMWARSADERRGLELPGFSFFDEVDETFRESVTWTPGHTFGLQPVANGVGFFASFYGRPVGVVRVTARPQAWHIPPGGTVFVIAPGLRRFAGPMTFPEFVASKLRPGEAQNSFSPLIRAVAALPPNPPFDLSDDVARSPAADQDLQRAAYFRWLRRGSPLWDDWTDWLQAEDDRFDYDDGP